MINAVKQFVESVIVILLLAAFLQIILPSGDMRRYAQLAIGLVMVLTLLTPLLALARAPFNLEELLGQATMQTSWQEIKTQGEIFKGQNDETLLRSYRATLTEQVKQTVEPEGEFRVLTCQFELVEDSQADDFGRILGMRVDLERQSSAVLPVSGVQPVQVGGTPADASIQPSVATAEQARTVLGTLANHFALSSDQVTVSIK